ncbi:MAG: dienelactone hydrolase family protein [Fimbriimonadaceae bacterium]|nr:dienelactone hydrolase family protein [Fimbriimonadaceae bacterium]
MGAMISFRSGEETYEGYLAKADGGGPGVVVIQEWWGLVPHIKEVADRFAAAGFNALAPDIYRGKSTTEPEEAGTLMMALRVPEAADILLAAIDALLAEPTTKGDRVGVVGFCMGGQLALFAATLSANVGACANFYGIHPHVDPDLSGLQGPVLGVFASNDPMTTPAVVSDLDARLTALGKAHEFVTYPDCDHAFFNDHRPTVYNPAAAQDAWERTLRLFRENLG